LDLQQSAWGYFLNFALPDLRAAEMYLDLGRK
jgi:hypothetical protein